MRTQPLLLALALAAGSCARAPQTPPARVTLTRTGGATFTLTPAEGQPPWCLAYTVTRAGLVRLLTMSSTNASIACPAGQPIGGGAFRAPLEEGPVRLHVIFTSQPVNAGSVSQQLLEHASLESLRVMDLRLPGNAAVETLAFTPEADAPAALGAVVDAGVGTP